jgi:acylphosphatase
MKRLTAYVSGSVQKTGYRAKVADFARMLGLKGTVENLDDSRVKILAEGNEDKLKWFEEAINIHDNLIQVTSIEREYSEPKGDFSRFYKLVDKGETDSRLDTAASHLNNLVGAVNNLNENLGKKMDVMIDSNQNLGKKMDVMIDSNENLGKKMDVMIDSNENLGKKMDVMIDSNQNLGKKMDVMIDSNENLGKKMDVMIDSNENLGKKMDVMVDLQRETLNSQENLLEEVQESRKDLKGYLEQRFEKLESEVTEMRAALREKGII